MNRILKVDVLVEDKLFVIFDIIIRRVYYKGKEFLFIDIVGFIRNLLYYFVEVFLLILEEVKYLNFILNVVDIFDLYYYDYIKVFEDLLKQFGVENIFFIRVYNKIDKVDFLSVDVFDNVFYVFIFVQDGRGIDILFDMIVERI